MNTRYCQSCGIPMKNENDMGTNSDGSKNSDYCRYCFNQGQFTPNCTLEQMIDICAQFVDEFKDELHNELSKNENLALLHKNLPKLKRWSQQ